MNKTPVMLKIWRNGKYTGLHNTVVMLNVPKSTYDKKIKPSLIKKFGRDWFGRNNVYTCYFLKWGQNSKLFQSLSEKGCTLESARIGMVHHIKSTFGNIIDAETRANIKDENGLIKSHVTVSGYYRKIEDGEKWDNVTYSL